MNRYKVGGSLFSFTGLIGCLAAFGSLVTRKNNGDTHYAWLGADDFLATSLLFSGAFALIYGGVSLYLAGDKLQNRTEFTKFDTNESDSLIPRIDQKIKNKLTNAYKCGLVAAACFTILSFYGLYTCFEKTPIPGSHIGPNFNKPDQMAGSFILYGLMALGSVVWTAYKHWPTPTTPRTASAQYFRTPTIK